MPGEGHAHSPSKQLSSLSLQRRLSSVGPEATEGGRCGEAASPPPPSPLSLQFCTDQEDGSLHEAPTQLCCFSLPEKQWGRTSCNSQHQHRRPGLPQGKFTLKAKFNIPGGRTDGQTPSWPWLCQQGLAILQWSEGGVLLQTVSAQFCSRPLQALKKKSGTANKLNYGPFFVNELPCVGELVCVFRGEDLHLSPWAEENELKMHGLKKGSIQGGLRRERGQPFRGPPFLPRTLPPNTPLPRGWQGQGPTPTFPPVGLSSKRWSKSAPETNATLLVQTQKT